MIGLKLRSVPLLHRCLPDSGASIEISSVSNGLHTGPSVSTGLITVGLVLDSHDCFHSLFSSSWVLFLALLPKVGGGIV